MPPFALTLSAAAVVLGTLAATPLPLDERALVAAGCVALGAYAYWKRCETPQLRVLVLCALAVGASNAVCRERGAEPPFELRTSRYEGVLVSRNADSQIVVALGDGRNVLAQIRGDAPPPGTRVELRGRLSSFDDARNPGEPSERAIQRERGIDAQLESAVLLRSRPGSPWDTRAWLARAHEWAYAQLQLRLGEPSASVVAGELWGERAALPPDLRLEFQETGTVHVLVTAGLHLGAVAALALALFSLGMPPRRLTCALAIIAVWIFALWSGAQLPAMRAAAMVTVALAARAFGRAALSWNSLAIAAAFVALVRPESVATASFALSFSCVGAIFALAKPLERRMRASTELPMPVREAIVLSIATQFGTWPLSAAIFLQFAAYSPLANFGVVPCVAATMALGAAQLALAWCAPLAQACANVNSWLLAWMLAVVRTLSSLPAASIPMTPAPAWCIAFYDVALLAAPWLWRKGAQTAAAAGVLIAAGFVLCPPREHDGRLRITVLDVGQADAIVVQTPAAHAILVDAGGRLERGPQGDDSTAERIGERIVVPFLLRSGIHALDAVILSHPHGDHVGGCSPVLRKLRVAEIADSGQSYGGHAYQDCLSVAYAKGVPVVYPRGQMEWQTDDGVTLHFLGPSLPFIANTRNDINENSVAFILRYKSFCMLFTGDAGASAEHRFLDQGIDLLCEVLKVGHHGSAYSSTPEFIAAVHPRYAIVSVGRHNLFGHPAPSTIETLRRIGAAVYRTDQNGALTVTSDGISTDVEPQLTPGDGGRN
jgi:competence protein ComEC